MRIIPMKNKILKFNQTLFLKFKIVQPFKIKQKHKLNQKALFSICSDQAGGALWKFGSGLVVTLGLSFSGSGIFPSSIRFWISCLNLMHLSVSCPWVW